MLRNESLSGRGVRTRHAIDQAKPPRRPVEGVFRHSVLPANAGTHWFTVVGLWTTSARERHSSVDSSFRWKDDGAHIVNLAEARAKIARISQTCLCRTFLDSSLRWKDGGSISSFWQRPESRLPESVKHAYVGYSWIPAFAGKTGVPYRQSGGGQNPDCPNQSNLLM